jgi:hypothetical protein
VSAATAIPDFGEFLDRIWVWPAGVSRDCTDEKNGLPCSDRDALVLCDSCKAFELACRDYSAEMEGEN